jgi:hypothetical protein
MKVTDTEETPLFYRVVLKNTKGVIHVQDCDFPPTADDYDGEVLSVTPLFTHPPKREPDGYFYTSHDWVGTRRDYSKEYPVSDAHTTYSDIEPYWLTPRDRGGEE